MAIPLNWYKETALVIREGLEKAGSPIPRVALVLGSGLGGLEEEMEQAAVFSYEDLPHMPQPSALGHAGTLTCGRLSGRETAVLSGRKTVCSKIPASLSTVNIRRIPPKSYSG